MEGFCIFCEHKQIRYLRIQPQARLRCPILYCVASGGHKTANGVFYHVFKLTIPSASVTILEALPSKFLSSLFTTNVFRSGDSTM